MTAPRRRPPDDVQPELPLDPGTRTRDHPGLRARDGEEWRLDEPTRRIGLRGVAQARALLGRPSGRDGQGQRRDGRGPSGRAA
ncbi:MAG TPA: hypothetical protein VII46_05175 [Acidimicrobiales bacterium]